MALFSESPVKAPRPILTTEDGITTDVKEEPLRAFSPITFNEDGNFIAFTYSAAPGPIISVVELGGNITSSAGGIIKPFTFGANITFLVNPPE